MGQVWATLLVTASSTLQSKPTVPEHGIAYLEGNCESHNRGKINRLVRRFGVSGVSWRVDEGKLAGVVFQQQWVFGVRCDLKQE